MAGSSNQFVYGLGVTQVVLGTGLTATQIKPPAGVNGMRLRWLSGGSLAILDGIGATTTLSYLLGTTETFDITGPATFFVAAAGTTATLGVVWTRSAGYSLQP